MRLFVLQDCWRKWHSNRRAQRLRQDIEALDAQEAALHADAALKIQCMIRQHAAKKQLKLARQARHDAILARVRARAAPAVAQTPVVPPPSRKCCNII